MIAIDDATDRFTGAWNPSLRPGGFDRLPPRVALPGPMKLLQPLMYVWAFPGSLVGLTATVFALTTGGRARIVEGVLEVHGGLTTRILMRGNRWVGPIAAITLGHVVVGCDQECLDRTRRHERVHVRQYERWGPFFIPAYLACSVWMGLRGYHAYLDNPFEVEAYAVDDAQTGRRSPSSGSDPASASDVSS